jgi:hypothetical protein
LKGNTVTIRQTDPTAPRQDGEPVAPTSPDIVIDQTLPPQASAELNLYDDVETYDETEPEAAEVLPETDAGVESETDGDGDPYDETEEPDILDEGHPGHNGDGEGDPDVAQVEEPTTQDATLDPQDEADVPEIPEGPADQETEGRPFLSDGGVFEERWNTIQIGFVDDPHHAVEDADQLVAEATNDLALILASHRKSLQTKWQQEDNVDTEQLRVVFRSYRGLLLGLLDT